MGVCGEGKAGVWAYDDESAVGVGADRERLAGVGLVEYVESEDQGCCGGEGEGGGDGDGDVFVG